MAMPVLLIPLMTVAGFYINQVLHNWHLINFRIYFFFVEIKIRSKLLKKTLMQKPRHWQQRSRR